MGIVIVAGGVSLFMKATVLQLKNMDRPRAFRVWISPSESFSIFYIHSIYQQPVIEEFQADQGDIVLRGVKTKSPAVMEYYGFDHTEEFHPVYKSLGALLVIRRGMVEGQGLIVRNRKIYLSQIGERGDRIQLSVKSTALVHYLFLVVSQFIK